MIYLQLFLSFFQVGLLSIGGGYAALPIIQNQIVDLHHWISLQEFTDIVTISQMTPGPIGINAATFVGTKVAGIPGAVVSTFGTVLPSFIIVLFLAWFYYKYRQLKSIKAILKGLRPAVVALIASSGISMIISAFWPEGSIMLSSINIESVIIFLVAFIVLRKFKIGPIKVMLSCGVFALLISFIF
ncbi:chromate transporter [Faecalicoccus pleomorphus]|uniref:chromate transporter n=1 Tax=Faecalicoccus pleomorphus TaxID=1323 RepID=UPI00232F3B30|nr:chromate transporter [Faecalicoccus pleomorphus]MDB7988654.1 chromate transporter [Faecalicoccus pleomorphus]MDB7992918.1 chromate transporter [Faecalicoccus pleomorphus]